MVPDELVVNTLLELTWLFDRVPMPKIMAPVTLVAPELLTAGKSIKTPLLSDANSGTGFLTCLLMLAVVRAVAAQDELKQVK